MKNYGGVSLTRENNYVVHTSSDCMLCGKLGWDQNISVYRARAERTNYLRIEFMQKDNEN